MQKMFLQVIQLQIRKKYHLFMQLLRKATVCAGTFETNDTYPTVGIGFKKSNGGSFNLKISLFGSGFCKREASLKSSGIQM